MQPFLTWRGASALAACALVAMAAGCESGLRSGASTAPSDADREVTVLLIEYEGAEAMSNAGQLSSELQRQGLSDAFVVDEGDKVAVCVGRFKSIGEPAARQTLARVRGIRDSLGQYPFAGALPVPVPERAPDTRWNLTDAPGLYSLHIASFAGPGRKQRAVDFTEKLRREGYEAYVDHGPRFSMVTLGAYGPEVFDDPSKVGVPGQVPKIISPEILGLQKKFPHILAEGVETPAATILRNIPGRETAGLEEADTQPAYRIMMARTGGMLVREAKGGALSQNDVAVLVAGQMRQLVGDLPRNSRAVIGVADIMDCNELAAQNKAGENIERLLVQALESSTEWPDLQVRGPEATQKALARARMSVQDVFDDPARLKGTGLDYVIFGTVVGNPKEPE